MKNRFKALLCLLLAIALFPAAMRSARADEPSGVCGDDLSWSFNEASGILTITGSSDMYDYGQTSGARAPWYSHCGNITTVQLPQGLTRIGNNAFYNCVRLRTAALPEGVTSIGAYAFMYCPLSENFPIPESVTVIGEHAFETASFRYVTIPAGVTSVGDGAFSGCLSLSGIGVDAGNADYTSVSGVLYDRNVTELIAYPAGAARSSYSIPGTVRIIRAYACESAPFTAVSFPDSVEEIREWAFFGCNNLQSLTVGSGVTSIGDHAFRTCAKLTTVSLSASVADVSMNAFSGCASFTAFTAASDNPAFATSDGVLLTKDRERIVLCPSGKPGHCTVPDGVARIGEKAFYWNTKLTSIYLPKSVTNIENNAFGQTSALTDVYYGGTQADRSDLLTIGQFNTRLLNAAWHYDPVPLSGTVEWNAEDVKYKGSTPYVIANGSAQTPRFTVKDADGNVIGASNYNYEYRENTNAGTGYVIVTFKGEYTGTCRGSFKIYLPATTATTVANVNDGIKLTWSAVDGAAGYVVYRRAWSSTTNGWTDFVRWNNTTALNWTDANVYAGTRYQYGIKAYFARRTDPVTGAQIGGNVGDNYNLGEVGPLKTTVRITTRTLSGVTPGNRQLTAKWTGSSVFTGYQLQYATNAAFTQNAAAVKITNPKTYTKTVTGLQNKTTYYVRVRSYHEFNGMTYFGEWSNVLSCKVQDPSTLRNYVLNSSTHKFHLPGCRDVPRISAENRIDYYGARDDLIGQGYSPCGHCNP